MEPRGLGLKMREEIHLESRNVIQICVEFTRKVGSVQIGWMVFGQADGCALAADGVYGVRGTSVLNRPERSGEQYPGILS